MTDKNQKSRKTKEILQKLQKPLAFSAEVCYNVAREKTDVLRVGFPYDFYDFLVYGDSHEIRSDDPRAARG